MAGGGTIQGPSIGASAAPAAAAPNMGAGGMPVCFLFDREPGVRRILSSMLASFQIRLEMFESFEDLLRAAMATRPDLIMIDVTMAGSGGIDVIAAFGHAKLSCPIQILSGLNAVLIEQVHRSGLRLGLTMLPTLHKPFRAGAVQSVLERLGLRRDRLADLDISLKEVIKEGWLELWYQPKINLKTRVMSGAEGFIRARHPDHGVITPDRFLQNASEDDLLDLTRRVLGRSLQDWPQFAAAGAPIELSINVPVAALNKLSIFGLMWEERPETDNWPGLVLELGEDDIVPNIGLATKAIAELRPYGISIAVDDFGSSFAELSRLKTLPFTEIKIDRSFICDCDTDPMRAGLCETLIEFAHRFGIKAVAEGIETKAELKVLLDMGCDLGQGHLFARPMPKSEFITAVRNRNKPTAAAQAARRAAS